MLTRLLSLSVVHSGGQGDTHWVSFDIQGTNELSTSMSTNEHHGHITRPAPVVVVDVESVQVDG